MVVLGLIETLDFLKKKRHISEYSGQTVAVDTNYL
jgi:hypothetical protein